MSAFTLLLFSLFMLFLGVSFSTLLIVRSEGMTTLEQIGFIWFFGLMPIWVSLVVLKLVIFNRVDGKIVFPKKYTKTFLGFNLIVFAPLVYIGEEMTFSIVSSIIDQGFEISMVPALLLVLIPVLMVAIGFHLIVKSSWRIRSSKDLAD